MGAAAGGTALSSISPSKLAWDVCTAPQLGKAIAPNSSSIGSILPRLRPGKQGLRIAAIGFLR
jgi:hypothetical protein